GSRRTDRGRARRDRAAAELQRLAVGRDLADLDAEPGGGRTRRRQAPGGQKERARCEVLEVEAELVLGVGGIERRGGRAGREHAEEETQELRAVGLGEGDPVARLDAARAEQRRERGGRLLE